MDTAYTEIVALPTELPELHDFLTEVYLSPGDQKKLIKLLDAVNRQSATNAVRYCTEVVSKKCIADDAERSYEAILEYVQMHDRIHQYDVYLAMYARLRKLGQSVFAFGNRAILRVLRSAVSVQLRIVTSLDARMR